MSRLLAILPHTIDLFCNYTLCPVLFSYYSLEDVSHESINKYLSNLVERSLRDLECSYCIEIKEVCVCVCNLLSNLVYIQYMRHRDADALLHGFIIL